MNEQSLGEKLKSLILEYNTQSDEVAVVDEYYMSFEGRGYHITFIGKSRWLIFGLEGYVHDSKTWLTSDDYHRKFSDEEILSIFEGILIINSMEHL